MKVEHSNNTASQSPAVTHIHETVVDRPIHSVAKKTSELALCILVPVAAFIFLPYPIWYFSILFSVIYLVKECCGESNRSPRSAILSYEDLAHRTHNSVYHQHQRKSEPNLPIFGPDPFSQPHVPVGSRIDIQRQQPTTPSLPPSEPHVLVGQRSPYQVSPMTNVTQIRATHQHVSVGNRPPSRRASIPELPSAPPRPVDHVTFIPPQNPREHVNVGSRALDPETSSE